MRVSIAALALTAAVGLDAVPVRGEDLTGLMDLRGVRVGMSVKELPADGYRAFGCVGAAKQQIAGWNEWKACPADASGLRLLTAEYDQPRVEGTFIAGHPVKLTLGFDDGSRLARITIATDPKARLYLRKKSFLLGQQAKYRYGENRWDCKDIKPTSNEEPLGPTLIKEHCTKKLQDREVTVERSLFRHPTNDPKDFVSETKISISWLGKPT